MTLFVIILKYYPLLLDYQDGDTVPTRPVPPPSESASLGMANTENVGWHGQILICPWRLRARKNMQSGGCYPLDDEVYGGLAVHHEISLFYGPIAGTIIPGYPDTWVE